MAFLTPRSAVGVNNEVNVVALVVASNTVAKPVAGYINNEQAGFSIGIVFHVSYNALLIMCRVLDFVAEEIIKSGKRRMKTAFPARGPEVTAKAGLLGWPLR